MNYHIDIQNATEQDLPLTHKEITQLVSLALKDNIDNAELTVRLVNDEEMRHLNSTYRQQNKTTNVLAFPSALPKEIQLDYPFLGDVIICPKILLAESIEMKKTLQSHWALILIHGVLHLLGYDHINEEDTVVMQTLEVQLLTDLGYKNPYTTEED